ncbi:hypothetical protein UCRPC4_g03261 [Phaeomoniella chlamydospora]|uniref:Proteinase n=1 Tax=Phaeomoniella chlamydospora TaxID=158046 RepID=A0A0G2GG87_PHACM|nr:hypothetical protein UCRPC4_g03261 [Phaeomoniella chlamydospora]
MAVEVVAQEKGQAWSPPSHPDRKTISRSTWTKALAIALLALIWLLRCFTSTPISISDIPALHQDDLPVPTISKPFRWRDIKPSQEIEYHDCFDGLQCTRLEVPLDYRRKDGKGQKVAIAMIRRPAKVPVTDKRYGGAIVIEPGGPGGSGVGLQMWLGPEIQYVVDSSADPTQTSVDLQDKYFDVIGFDPRGVNNTTPAVSCFPDAYSAQTWQVETQAEGILGSSNHSLHNNWRRARALAEGCSDRLLELEDGEAIGEHINTVPVVEDIVQMIERHGEWREKQAAKEHQTYAKINGQEAADAMLERTKWKKGEENLLYWGFSYGTVIGATFAAMHPDRIERMVLDGVCDADDYYHGTWFSNLWDTDKILARFFEYCSEAGPTKCPFYYPGGPHEIQQAYERLMNDIHDDPLSVPGTNTRGPYLVTWSDLKVLLSPGLYQPLHLLPIVADLFNDIARSNGSKYADYKESKRKPVCRTEECELNGPFSQECNVAADASSAILCSDSPGLGQVNEEEFSIYWSALKDQCAAIGDSWAHTRLGCVGWNAKAKWNLEKPVSGQPAHPLLFIGNTLDTVTPIRNARKMALQFPGSVVLEQKAEGHCSFTAPSICTANHVKKYFQTGVLPQEDGKPGAVCETDMKPLLDSWPPETASAEGLDILRQASKKFAEMSPQIHFAL